MNTGRWEDVRCPICPTSTVSSPYLDCSDRLCEPLLKNYRLVRCSGCGLIYLNPRPAADQADELHPREGYDPFISLQAPQDLLGRGYLIARRLTTLWKRRLAARLKPRGSRVLDIGCGTGEFLKALQPDFEVSGTEPEPNAARWARERLGLNVLTGSLKQLPPQPHRFDLVTLWHVFEHLPDPDQVLVTLRRLLTPSGLLLLAMPNIGSLDAAIYRSNWVALDAPRHLWHFRRHHIAALADRAGLRIVRSGVLPLDTLYNVLWSERLCLITGGKLQLLISPFRSILAAASSLFWGAVSGQHSGIYFVLEIK